MEKNDLIVVGTVGGALVLIVWLASKNRNKADEGIMPYGWGSFQNSNNGLTPIDPNTSRDDIAKPPKNWLPVLPIDPSDVYIPPRAWLPVEPIAIDATPIQPKTVSITTNRPRVNSVIKPVKPLVGVI